MGLFKRTGQKPAEQAPAPVQPVYTMVIQMDMRQQGALPVFQLFSSPSGMGSIALARHLLEGALLNLATLEEQQGSSGLDGR